MSYTYTRSETNDLPHTQPQCCPTCRKALLLTILNSAVILAAIVSAVVFHLVIGINSNITTSQGTSCGTPRADPQSDPVFVGRQTEGEPKKPTVPSDEDYIIATEYSSSTTNTVPVTSTSSPTPKSYIENVTEVTLSSSITPGELIILLCND